MPFITSIFVDLSPPFFPPSLRLSKSYLYFFYISHPLFLPSLLFPFLSFIFCFSFILLLNLPSPFSYLFFFLFSFHRLLLTLYFIQPFPLHLCTPPRSFSPSTPLYFSLLPFIPNTPCSLSLASNNFLPRPLPPSLTLLLQLERGMIGRHPER